MQGKQFYVPSRAPYYPQHEHCNLNYLNFSGKCMFHVDPCSIYFHFGSSVRWQFAGEIHRKRQP